MLKHTIQHITIDLDLNVEISYFTPATDLKEPGIALLKTLVIPHGSEYDDEIQALYDAAHYLISDVLDDFDDLPRLDPPDQDPEVPEVPHARINH